jgi:hypothetical protein
MEVQIFHQTLIFHLHILRLETLQKFFSTIKICNKNRMLDIVKTKAINITDKHRQITQWSFQLNSSQILDLYFSIQLKILRYHNQLKERFSNQLSTSNISSNFLQIILLGKHNQLLWTRHKLIFSLQTIQIIIGKELKTWELLIIQPS